MAMDRLGTWHASKIRPRKRLLLSLIVLFAVYWIGVAGYVVLEDGVTMFDAMYMVMITVSGVGYRETITLDEPGRVWTMLIIVFGMFAVLSAFTSLAGMVVEGEIGRLIGSRRLEARISRISGHAIVCGFGRVGRQVVRLLQERGIPVVVVEKELTRTQEAEQADFLYIVGDATEEETLNRAGIERASHLVAVLHSDADNVFVTLSAHEMNSELFIVARAEQLATVSKLRRAGANRVISPQTIGAERIANLITRPHVVDFVDVAGKGVELEMDEFLVPASSPIGGRTLREANLRRVANVMVVAIRGADGQSRFNPSADETLRAGDTLIMIGPAGAAQKLADMQLLDEAPVE